jgi:hypothetical protein
MATVLDTFITKFRFETDKTGLREAEKGLANFKGSVLKIGASIAAILGGGAFLGHIAETTDEMGKFAESVGVSVDQLQELQFVAQRSGVPVNSLRSSLQMLNGVVGEAARGYGIYGQVLARFGVNIRNSDGTIMNSFQLMKQLNTVFQGLDKAQQFDLAKNLGINPQTVMLLQQTPKTFDAMIAKSKELGLVTAKQTKEAAKFEDGLTNLKQSFFALSVEIGSFLFPVLTKLTNFLASAFSWINKHMALFKAIGIALLPTLLDISAAFTAIAVDAAVAWAIVLAPITLIGAAVAALVLIVQDLWTGFRGGHSVILSFLKNSKLVQSVWGEIKKVVDVVVGSIEKAVKFTEKVGHYVSRFAKKGVSSVGRGAKDVEHFFGFGKKSPAIPTVADSPVGRGAKDVDHFFGFSKTSPAIPTLAASPVGVGAGTTSSSIAHHQTVNVGGVTVNAKTNASAKDISDAVTNTLKNQLRTSAVKFDGVIAR